MLFSPLKAANLEVVTIHTGSQERFGYGAFMYLPAKKNSAILPQQNGL